MGRLQFRRWCPAISGSLGPHVWHSSDPAPTIVLFWSQCGTILLLVALMSDWCYVVMSYCFGWWCRGGPLFAMLVRSAMHARWVEDRVDRSQSLFYVVPHSQAGSAKTEPFSSSPYLNLWQPPLSPAPTLPVFNLYLSGHQELCCVTVVCMCSAIYHHTR